MYKIMIIEDDASIRRELYLLLKNASYEPAETALFPTCPSRFRRKIRTWCFWMSTCLAKAAWEYVGSCASFQTFR